MRAGLLQTDIEIHRPTITTNAVGEQITTYTLVNTIRAHVVTSRSTRTETVGEIWQPTSKTIEIRIFQDVTETDLVKMNGKYYRILSIETDRQLQCKRIELAENNE